MFEALASERSIEEREHGEMWWCREHQGIVTLRDSREPRYRRQEKSCLTSQSTGKNGLLQLAMPSWELVRQGWHPKRGWKKNWNRYLLWKKIFLVISVLNSHGIWKDEHYWVLLNMLEWDFCCTASNFMQKAHETWIHSHGTPEIHSTWKPTMFRLSFGRKKRYQKQS